MSVVFYDCKHKKIIISKYGTFLFNDSDFAILSLRADFRMSRALSQLLSAVISRQGTAECNSLVQNICFCQMDSEKIRFLCIKQYRS